MVLKREDLKFWEFDFEKLRNIISQLQKFLQLQEKIS